MKGYRRLRRPRRPRRHLRAQPSLGAVYYPNPVWLAPLLSALGLALGIATTAGTAATTARRRREEREAREEFRGQPLPSNELQLTGREAARGSSNYNEARRWLIDLARSIRQRDTVTAEEEAIFKAAFEEELEIIRAEERAQAEIRAAEHRAAVAERYATQYAPRVQAAYERIEEMRQRASRARLAQRVSAFTGSPLLPVAGLLAALAVGFFLLRKR